MKKNVFYTKEKYNLAFIILFLMGFFSLGYFIYLRISAPDIWSPNGFFIALIFMLIFNTIIVILIYFNYYSRKNFILKRDQILKNGLVVEGKISNITHNISILTQSDGDTHITLHYYALVSYECGNKIAQFCTPELNFLPQALTSNKVNVHVYHNEIYVDGYQLGDNKDDVTLLENDNHTRDSNINILSNIKYIYQIICGLFAIVTCVWIILKLYNIFAQMAFIPFILCAIAIMLSGTLHLIYHKGSKKNINIRQKIDSYTKKLFLVGASLFWFGLLIVADYSFLQERNIQMFLFSLIFWAAGIYVIYSNWKES